MVFFIAAGTISNDVVRKETRNGVLATFRLETGAPRNGKLWIDIETWGHLAGTIAHHASKGRGVTVSGRLTQKTWRDKETGESRHRYVVTAHEIDLHEHSEEQPPSVSPPNAVLVRGIVEALHPCRPVRNGTINSFRIATGKANSKAGRLWLDVEHWQPADHSGIDISQRAVVTIVGSIACANPTQAHGKNRPAAYHLNARLITIEKSGRPFGI